MTTEELQYCCRILGLEPSSSVEIIKRTFRKLIKEWHPDRFHGHDAKTLEANEKLKEIIPAYENLLAFYSGKATQIRRPATHRSNPPPPTDAKTQFEEGNRQQKRGDYESALRWFRQSAEQGYVDAMLALGNLFFEGFFDGTTFKQDYAEAARWYRLAGEKDHAEAQYKFGSIREYGYYKEPDFREALDWYLKAANQGYAKAQLAAGQLYKAIRRGIKQDDHLANFWFRKAAAQGVAEAEYALGQLYEWGGQGVKKDFVEAAKWYQRAAEKGHEYAQFEIARFHEEGLGVPLNTHEADRWLRRSDWAGKLKREAKAGMVTSQASLAHMYETGIGIERDLGKAVKWYRKASLWGLTNIQIKLAKLYSTGSGTPRNLTEAFKWLTIVNRPNDQDVKALLESLASEMSDKDIKKAKRLALKFAPVFMQNSKKRRK